MAPSAFIYIGLIICGLIWRKHKPLFWTMVIFMFLLYAFSTTSADIGTYQSRYYDVQEVSVFTEPFFTALTILLRIIGLPFLGYIAVLTMMAMAFPVYLIYRHSNVPCGVFALYMIYSLPIDLTQLRSTIGFSIALLGIYICWRKHYRQLWIAALLIVVGAMFHTAAIVFLLFFPVVLLQNYTERKWLYPVAFIAAEIGGMIFLTSGTVRSHIAGWFNIGYFLDHALIEGWSVPGFTAKALFCFFACQYLLHMHRLLLRENTAGVLHQEEQYRFNEFAKLLNITTLFTIPFFVLSADIYRVQRSIFVIEMIAIFCGGLKVRKEHDGTYSRSFRRIYPRYFPIALISYMAIVYAFFIFSKDYESTLYALLKITQ